MRPLRWTSTGLVLALALAATSGCSQKRDVMGQVTRGEYGRASQVLAEDLEKDKSKRDYMYDRMVLSIVDLADGRPASSEPIVEELFTILNTRGVNQDKTVAAVVMWEGVKFWKGEPFEQALMLNYIALQKASLGRWDDARAASLNSLFWLKDFAKDKGSAANSEELAREAARVENEKGGDEDYLESGYTAAESVFALGHLVAAATNRVLGAADPDRQVEAGEHLASAYALNNNLKPLTDRLQRGDFNTVLVVDYGLGPVKVAYGMDNVFARFEPRSQWPSGREPLVVRVNDGPAEDFAVACDVNVMATDLKWNNTEDVREAKSYLGTALLAGGAAAVAFGNSDMQVAGVVMGAVGAYSKATAAADTTYCALMPQRVYVAALTVGAPDSTLRLRVGAGGQELVLPGVDPPAGPQRFQLRYVRIPPTQVLPLWAGVGQVKYANDQHVQPVPGDTMPYILGGRCVRFPTQQVLSHYQGAGNLQGMTLDELCDLYREEGVVLDRAESQRALEGRHILEGGTSLACPLDGTAGYVRLFCQEQPPYQPKSQRLRELASQLRDRAP